MYSVQKQCDFANPFFKELCRQQWFIWKILCWKRIYSFEVLIFSNNEGFQLFWSTMLDVERTVILSKLIFSSRSFSILKIRVRSGRHKQKVRFQLCWICSLDQSPYKLIQLKNAVKKRELCTLAVSPQILWNVIECHFLNQPLFTAKTSIPSAWANDIFFNINQPTKMFCPLHWRIHVSKNSARRWNSTIPDLFLPALETLLESQSLSDKVLRKILRSFATSFHKVSLATVSKTCLFSTTERFVSYLELNFFKTNRQSWFEIY